MNLVSWPRAGSGKFGPDRLHAVCARRNGYTVCNWRIPVRRYPVGHSQGEPTCKQCLRILAVRVKHPQFVERTAEAAEAAEAMEPMANTVIRRRKGGIMRGPTHEEIQAAVRRFEEEGGIIRKLPLGNYAALLAKLEKNA